MGFQGYSVNPTSTALIIITSGSFQTWSHLHLLDDLLAEGAHLGGASDGHVLGALVLAGDAVERCGVLLHTVAQVRLDATPQRPTHPHLTQTHYRSTVEFYTMRTSNEQDWEYMEPLDKSLVAHVQHIWYSATGLFPQTMKSFTTINDPINIVIL